MPFPLYALSPTVGDRAPTWTALGMRWQVGPIQPNYGKAFVNAQFESAAWIIDIAIWSSGEAELATIHLPDDRIVNKHYDLTGRADLVVLLDELTALLLRDEVPAAAVVLHAASGGHA